MARPRLTEHRKGFLIKLLAEEKQHIEVTADHAGLTASEFVRRCVMKRRIHPKINEKAMGELARLGGLQKLCMKGLKDMPHSQDLRAQLNAVLNAILVEIERVRKMEG
jgi:hypothetical protein